MDILRRWQAAAVRPEIVATAGASEIVTRPLSPDFSIRLFTGSPVRADVAGVVMEERCA
jgi:hypothetical protein